jgi:hypothetical protein
MIFNNYSLNVKNDFSFIINKRKQRVHDWTWLKSSVRRNGTTHSQHCVEEEEGVLYNEVKVQS